ncbi:MAG: DUF1566 domain-containing protein [bacterium]
MKEKVLFVLTIAVAFIFFLSCGEEGKPGKDGSSCTIVVNEDGSKKLVCDDGTEAEIVAGNAAPSIDSIVIDGEVYSGTAVTVENSAVVVINVTDPDNEPEEIEYSISGGYAAIEQDSAEKNKFIITSQTYGILNFTVIVTDGCQFSVADFSIKPKSAVLPSCGNGIIEPGEVCDGNAKSCKTLGLGDSSVIVECKEDCSGWATAGICKRTFVCDGKLEHSVWNSVSEYEQTWDGEKWEPADSVAEYSEETSDESCRFKCAEDVDWDKEGLKCKDPFIFPHAGLDWSKKSSNTKGWISAVTYCENLSGRLPTISEFRTLIQNCPATETGGECTVTDECLSYSSCWSDSCYGHYPEGDNTGKHSAFGDTDWFWSASELSDHTDYAWGVHFFNGYVYSNYKTGTHYARCVR